ncbi:MAG: helix-turn-helix domain-containing protein [Bacteroidales bacterium]|nr:helix-turn-helix domain-containing protein [Bacteroidales bacterium]
MKKKKHLTREQRYTISVLLKQGYSQSFIAKTIGKDRSVISREIKRNSSDKRGVYNYKTAQRKADFRNSVSIEDVSLQGKNENLSKST